MKISWNTIAGLIYVGNCLGLDSSRTRGRAFCVGRAGHVLRPSALTEDADIAKRRLEPALQGLVKCVTSFRVDGALCVVSPRSLLRMVPL